MFFSCQRLLLAVGVLALATPSLGAVGAGGLQQQPSAADKVAQAVQAMASANDVARAAQVARNAAAAQGGKINQHAGAALKHAQGGATVSAHALTFDDSKVLLRAGDEVRATASSRGGAQHGAAGRTAYQRKEGSAVTTREGRSTADSRRATSESGGGGRAVGGPAPAPAPTDQEDLDIDSGGGMPYGELGPFGREDEAKAMTDQSVDEQDEMIDQLERAEVAEEKRAVFRALTRLRGAVITAYDGIARTQTANVDTYNKKNKWRDAHPMHHLAEEESDYETWAFPGPAVPKGGAAPAAAPAEGSSPEAPAPAPAAGK